VERLVEKIFGCCIVAFSLQNRCSSLAFDEHCVVDSKLTGKRDEAPFLPCISFKIGKSGGTVQALNHRVQKSNATFFCKLRNPIPAPIEKDREP
jgi:hypothetical protein